MVGSWHLSPYLLDSHLGLTNSESAQHGKKEILWQDSQAQRVKHVSFGFGHTQACIWPSGFSFLIS